MEWYELPEEVDKVGSWIVHGRRCIEAGRQAEVGIMEPLWTT
jgi:hypothetical protein